MPPVPAEQTALSRQPLHSGLARRHVRRINGTQIDEHEENLAKECAVALVYNGEPHVVMMATPRDLEDFALGFSLSENIIAEPGELLDFSSAELPEGIQLSLRIPPARELALRERPRGLEGRSGCGLCGVRHLADAVRPPRHAGAGSVITTAALRRAFAALSTAQPLNAACGAVHAAAWADADGTLHWLREDVGRHNALDKLIGAMARAQLDASRGFALLTSRASYEMVLKSASACIPLVAAISAPTALAVELADEAGITLIGFARENRCTVYTRPGRIRVETDTPRAAEEIRS